MDGNQNQDMSSNNIGESSVPELENSEPQQQGIVNGDTMVIFFMKYM